MYLRVNNVARHTVQLTILLLCSGPGKKLLSIVQSHFRPDKSTDIVLLAKYGKVWMATDRNFGQSEMDCLLFPRAL